MMDEASKQHIRTEELQVQRCRRTCRPIETRSEVDILHYGVKEQK